MGVGGSEGGGGHGWGKAWGWEICGFWGAGERGNGRKWWEGVESGWMGEVSWRRRDESWGMSVRMRSKEVIAGCLIDIGTVGSECGVRR